MHIVKVIGGKRNKENESKSRILEHSKDNNKVGVNLS